MIDVRNIFKRKSGAATAAATRSQLVEEPIPARSVALFGRTIAIMPNDQSVRMAAVRHRGTQRTVLDVREVVIPETVADASDRRRLVQQAIAEFTRQYGGHGVSLRLTVSGKDTAFRSFLMPVLKAHDLRDAVQIEAGRQLPFPVADCSLDYRPVARIVSGDQSRYKIALFAATQRRVRQLLQPFDELKTTVDTILHNHDVVGQVLPSLPDFAHDKSYTILSIGTKSSEIAFYRGSTLEFFHQTNTGSAMAGDLTDPTRREYFAETLATDIQTSFDYFAGQHASSSMPVIHVCGLPAEDPELIQGLEERVGMRCQRLPIETLHGITFASPEAQSGAIRMFPVVAAALNTARVANLLPTGNRVRLKNHRIDTIGRFAVAVTVLILAGAWALLNREMQIGRQSAEVMQAQVAEMESSAPYRALQHLQGRLAATREYIRKTEKQPTFLGLNLKELSHLAPRSLRLTRFDLTADSAGQATGDLRLYGVVVSDDIPPEVTLAEFVERLAASPYYDKVEVERHVKRERDGVFTIDFQLVMRGVV